MKKCKHNCGWLTDKDVNIFIFDDGKISFNFEGKDTKYSKLKVRCNIPNCDKIRNVYIKAEVVKWGKSNKKEVKMNKLEHTPTALSARTNCEREEMI